MNILFLFSLFDENDPLLELGAKNPVMRDRLIFFSAIFLVVCLVTAGILRRREHNRRRSFHRAAAGVVDLNKVISKKPRRSRSHRSRNPTLAETGGLPPVRSAEPLEPPQTRTQLL